MTRKTYFEVECDNCESIIELVVETDDDASYCPCCGAMLEYEEDE